MYTAGKFLAIPFVALPLFLSAGTPDQPACDVWRVACHYTVSSREATYDINRVVIHKTEGATAAGAASWFANCSSGGSAHYTYDKANGYCYQSVREKDVAWHAGYGSTNNCSVGIEHSGWVASNDTSTACYDKSAVETRSCVVYYGVPCNRSYIIGHSEVPGCGTPGGGGTSCHTDPGRYWNWGYYMGKCNPTPSYPWEGQRDFALYQITNVHSGKALDLPGCSWTDGVQVQQYSPLGNDPQTWQLVPCGDGWYKIRSLCTGKLVDVNGGVGPKVQQWPDNGNVAQQFRFEVVSSNPKQYRIVSRSCGKPLEIANAWTHEGAPVQTWDWNGHNCQRWTLTHIPFRSGWYEFQNGYSGKMLDVPGGSNLEALQMWQWDAAGWSGAQRFELTHTGNGWYKVRALCTDKLLDVAGSSSANGTGLITWFDNGGAAQRFSFAEAQPGLYRMVSMCFNGANKCIEVAGGTTPDGAAIGANIIVWDWWGGSSQMWRIVASPFFEGDFDIVQSRNGKALDVSQCSTAAGAQLQQYDRLGNVCQSFRIVPMGAGYYAIKSNRSGLMLDVNGCNPANGTKLIQWNDLGNDCQRFRFVLKDPCRAVNDYFIQNKNTGTVLDNTGGSTANGNLITMWGMDSWSGNQGWRANAK